MTTEITVPTPTDQFMAALSAAEHVTAASPIAPYTVSLGPLHDWGFLPGTSDHRIGVQLHFDSVGDVHRFAEALRVVTAEREHSKGKTYTFADGVLKGVPFRAWSLTAVEAGSVAA